jgi:DNA helicase MCM8
MRGWPAPGGGAAAAGLSLALVELQGIRDIAAEKSLFELLVASMCPSIYGHEVVKAGLTLALFGGCASRSASVAPGCGKRADIHVLVVGDPGMGKSQMLTATSALAPRGVYVCGNTTSASGLTVTVVKDTITGDFALEAGALVMGDQGCCCIDEFGSPRASRTRGPAAPPAPRRAQLAPAPRPAPQTR